MIFFSLRRCRCVISSISKEATEAILQLDAKEQENMQKIQFSMLLTGILRKLNVEDNAKKLYT